MQWNRPHSTGGGNYFCTHPGVIVYFWAVLFIVRNCHTTPTWVGGINCLARYIPSFSEIQLLTIGLNWNNSTFKELLLRVYDESLIKVTAVAILFQFWLSNLQILIGSLAWMHFRWSTSSTQANYPNPLTSLYHPNHSIPHTHSMSATTCTPPTPTHLYPCPLGSATPALFHLLDPSWSPLCNTQIGIDLYES